MGTEKTPHQVAGWKTREQFTDYFYMVQVRLAIVAPVPLYKQSTAGVRRSSLPGRCCTSLEQATDYFPIGQITVNLPEVTETHSVRAVIPRHYYMTSITASVPSSGLAT